MVLPTKPLHIRMPIENMNVIESEARECGLSPAMVARKKLCEQFKVKK